MNKLLTILIGVLFSISCLAMEKQNDHQGNRGRSSNESHGTENQSRSQGHRGGPPKESFDACESKSSGDECSFTGRRGKKLEGVCKSPNANIPVNCRPKNHPQRMN